MKPSLLRDQRGLSLIEVMITTVLVAVVFAAAFSLFDRGVWSFRAGDSQIDLQQHLRIGMDRLTREIRTALQLTNQSTETELYLIDQSGNTVHYYLAASGVDIEGMQLQRAVKKSGNSMFDPADPVANYIDSISFWYNDPGAVLPADASIVTIKLVGKAKNKTVVQQSEVQIRMKTVY